MGSGSELSAELSMLLMLLLLLLLLLPLLLLMALSLLMALLLLMVLLLLLVLLMLLVLFEIEVASFSARTGWRGTRMAKRAKERRRSILRVCSVVSSFLSQTSHLEYNSRLARCHSERWREGESDWKGSQSRQIHWQ